MERKKACAAALLSLVAAFSLPPGGVADAVAPAPTSCPGGTHGVTGHAGTGCAPNACPHGAAGVLVCLGAVARRRNVRC
ncbi:hypothetical protein WME91_19970 [Sorangium sp. So ce269]